MDLTEAEDIKKRWQEYTEEVYKKDLHNPDNHDGMIIVGTAPQPTHPSVLSLGLADHWQAQMRFLISFSSWLKQPPLLAQTPPSTRTCWDPTLAPPWPLDLLLWSCPTDGGLPGPGHRGWLLLCILCDRGCSAETHSSWPSIMWKALLLGGGECTLIS